MWQKIGVVLALIALLAGCGGRDIDTPRLERQIQHWAEKQSSGVTGIKADCPEKITVEAGRDFHCILSDDQGDSYRVTVTIENNDGDVTWQAG